MRSSAFRISLLEHIDLFKHLSECHDDFYELANLLIGTLDQKRNIFIAGNGGSAADASHFAAELNGRYELVRPALPAFDLVSNCASITAISNDFDFSEIFSRQILAAASPSDVLICLSTSGNSENLIKAAVTAKSIGLNTVSLLGKDGGQLLDLSDISILIPSFRTCRIQEAHMFILHEICSVLDNHFANS